MLGWLIQLPLTLRWKLIMVVLQHLQNALKDGFLLSTVQQVWTQFDTSSFSSVGAFEQADCWATTWHSYDKGTETQQGGEVSLCGIRMYHCDWRHRCSADAHLNDVSLINCLTADSALKSLAGHMWYLTKELVPLVLLSTSPAADAYKQKVVDALRSHPRSLVYSLTMTGKVNLRRISRWLCFLSIIPDM